MGEEAEVDSLLEALLEEHGHVDIVGGEADEEEDGDEDGELDPVKEELRLTTDHVFGVVPRDGHVHIKDDAVVWDSARRSVDVIRYNCPWCCCLCLCHGSF